jgi:hypothetical protein
MRVVACAALALLAAPAWAQVAGEFIGRSPAEVAHQAFDTEYGRLLVARFGSVLRDSAQPRCLRATAIDPATLEVRGRELLIRTTTRMLEIHAGVVDEKKLYATFAAIAGKDALAERERLREHPDVRRYLEMLESARRARLADHVIDAVGKSATRQRFVFSKDPALLPHEPALKAASPELANQQSATAIAEGRPSAALRRWLELSFRMNESLQQAADYDRILRLGPEKMTPDLAGELGNLCVPQGTR